MGGEGGEVSGSKLTPEQIEKVLSGLGARYAPGSWKQASEAVNLLSGAHDETLVAVLLSVHLKQAHGDKGVEVARDAMRALVELRASKRQREQTEALVMATRALEATVRDAATASGKLTTRIGLATIVILAAGVLVAFC